MTTAGKLILGFFIAVLLAISAVGVIYGGRADFKPHRSDMILR